MVSFHRIVGKQVLELEESWRENYPQSKVLIDIGTGDGRFIIDAAKEDSDCLCIGLDAASDNMLKHSRTAAAKPKKGGLDNAMFLRGAAENLPGPLVGIADSVTINYPWGSLMRIVSEPDTVNLNKIRQICKQGAELSIFLNMYVFDDEEYLHRLGMGDLKKPDENEHFIQDVKSAGFDLHKMETFVGDPPIRTMWGRHLVRGSNRSTMLIEANAT